jgi:hypothetical protein
MQRKRERRNAARRALVLQYVINSVLENPSVTLTTDILQQWVQVPMSAAERILQRLASSGLLREVQRGVWTPAKMPGASLTW